MEGSVRSTSMYQLVQISCQMSSDQLLLVQNFFYKTSYLDEEVNCIKPSPSARVPWCIHRERTNLRSILASLSHIIGFTWFSWCWKKIYLVFVWNTMLRQCIFPLFSNTLAFSLHKHSRLFNFLWQSLKVNSFFVKIKKGLAKKSDKHSKLFICLSKMFFQLLWQT